MSKTLNAIWLLALVGTVAVTVYGIREALRHPHKAKTVQPVQLYFQVCVTPPGRVANYEKDCKQWPI